MEPTSLGLVVLQEERLLLAELAELRKDKERLEWCMSLLSLTGDSEAVIDARTVRLGGALLLSKSGREAIDEAMGVAR